MVRLDCFIDWTETNRSLNKLARTPEPQGCLVKPFDVEDYPKEANPTIYCDLKPPGNRRVLFCCLFHQLVKAPESVVP